LAQWAQRTAHRVGWVSVDERDNDPAVLLTYLAVALDRVEPIDPRVIRGLAGLGASIMGAVPRLAAAMAAMTGPVALVLDHLEVLENQACLDVVAELAAQLPPGAQLLVASRVRPPLPVGLLRVQGRVLELGVEELAMDDREARALLEGAGVGLDDAEVDELIGRTEGWPVGLYLAALAHKAGGPRRPAWAGFTGDDRFMADYLRSELLARLPPELVAFLTRTAVLERMSGPLCDAVLETTGSARVLASLEESNLLLVPLDRQRRWYRYHHLFHELLVAELDRREPDLVPALHHRAAGWCEVNRLPETAIDHAQAAGDADRVARLVWQLALPAYGAGRVDTTRRWFGWFEDQGLLGRYPSWPCSGLGCRPWWGSRRRPSAGPTRQNRGQLAGRSRTVSPSRAIWRCCGRCCAATVWTGCGPTPRPPWPS
jgi:LuxR family maltose regulon positive regulatory protein